MKTMKRHSSLSLTHLVCAAIFTLTSVTVALAQGENIGKVQQGLVGGALVSAEQQEEYGLLSLDTGCSGSLLRNNWVLTAAHCVDNPDPNNKGQFILVPEDSVTVSAAWKVAQQQTSMRIITFRPLDVAIIRVAAPFSVHGSMTNYNRDIFRDGQFPYFGDPSGVPITIFGRGIYQFATGSGASATPALRDGLYRVGFVKTTRQDNDSGQRYWYPSIPGASIAGGDSGGAAFTEVLNRGPVIVGVHSLCKTSCASGKICGPWPGPGKAPANYSNWGWITGTSECADAPVAPVWDEINRYLGAFTTPPDPSVEYPASGFIGTFSKTPPNYQPLWVYAIKNDGDMLWYRKDTGDLPWQGPKKVGNGWNFKDVIPAGGNSMFALTNEGKLLWYRHDGFNDGSRAWPQPTQVGNGWTFAKIFSGGAGIVYAIRDDGTLLWYKDSDYAGGSAGSWAGPKTVGAQTPTSDTSSICDKARAARARNSPAAPGLEAQCRATGETQPATPTAATNWSSFRDVFSNGEGMLYGVTPEGNLVYYYHSGYQTGEPKVEAGQVIASGWQNYRQIVPAGGGVILAIAADGKMYWFRHYYDSAGTGALRRVKAHWEGPVEIGSGWTGFKKVLALLPVPTSSLPVVR